MSVPESAPASTTTTSTSSPPTYSSTAPPTSSTTSSIATSTTSTPGLNGPGGGLAAPITQPASRRGILTGDVITIDPGYNGANYAHASYIDHLVWNGRADEARDLTGTATDSG